LNTDARGIAARRAREKEELRRKILNAAGDLFTEEGFDNVSMRKIGERIEYSPTTIYLYFRDKLDLLVTISDETLDRLVSAIEESVKEVTDPVEKFREFGRAYIEFGLARPHEYELTFVIRPRYRGGLDLPEDSATKRAFDSLAVVVEECVAQGVFRDVDPMAAAQALWASVHGVTSLLIAYPDFPWAERELLVTQMLDTITDGHRIRPLSD